MNAETQQQRHPDLMESNSQVGSDPANCNSESEEFANIRINPVPPAEYMPMQGIGELPRVDLPPLDFVLPGLLKGTVGVLASPGGMGKSMLTLQIAASIIRGRDDHGFFPGFDLQQGRVAIINLEDDELVLRHRIQSISRRYDPAEWSDVSENLYVLPTVGQDFSIVDAEGGLSKHLATLTEYFRAWRPRLIIIDTLNRATGGIPENEAGVAGRLMRVIEQLAASTGAAVILCHHTGKGADPTSAEAVRGSSVLIYNARWVGILSAMSRKDAAAKGLEGIRESLVRLSIPKVNYAAQPGDIWLQRGEGGVLDLFEEQAVAAEADEGRADLNLDDEDW